MDTDTLNTDTLNNDTLNTDTLNTDAAREKRARQRAKSLVDFLWHLGVFVIVNAFVWMQDYFTGGGIEWAFWVTIPWGMGLALHGLAYLMEGRMGDFEDRKTKEYLGKS
jgi:hypothetical protein